MINFEVSPREQMSPRQHTRAGGISYLVIINIYVTYVFYIAFNVHLMT